MSLIFAIFIVLGFVFVAISIFSDSNQETEESIGNSKPEENLQTLATSSSASLNNSVALSSFEEDYYVDDYDDDRYGQPYDDPYDRPGYGICEIEDDGNYNVWEDDYSGYD